MVATRTINNASSVLTWTGAPFTVPRIPLNQTVSILTLHGGLTGPVPPPTRKLVLLLQDRWATLSDPVTLGIVRLDNGKPALVPGNGGTVDIGGLSNAFPMGATVVAIPIFSANVERAE